MCVLEGVDLMFKLKLFLVNRLILTKAVVHVLRNYLLTVYLLFFHQNSLNPEEYRTCQDSNAVLSSITG